MDILFKHSLLFLFVCYLAGSFSHLCLSLALSQSGVHSEGNSSPFVKYVMDKSGAHKVIKSLTLALLKERERDGENVKLNTENKVRIFGGGEWEKQTRFKRCLKKLHIDREMLHGKR